MRYKVELTKQSKKFLSKMDKFEKTKIINWIEKNLNDCENPYAHGKALESNLKGYWRYRVGNYRVIAEINNEQINILIVAVGHRSVIYKILNSF